MVLGGPRRKVCHLDMAFRKRIEHLSCFRGVNPSIRGRISIIDWYGRADSAMSFSKTRKGRVAVERGIPVERERFAIGGVVRKKSAKGFFHL